MTRICDYFFSRSSRRYRTPLSGYEALFLTL